ncbi:Hpt domain-containing protein [Pseudodonghicola flavimaris]|uniref:Hpt domain-containing protein n=1 Tax=Pseudodonghicola flavimaris TaxID=3050036 RepID=A0ABT7EWM9_9RHOB|nr:Hpt domain-containing protein [Pseudodonghicola flavimaris]MDK3016741.1 Hpt domain-containing protein [Pseudodonghicola flavimaris]
MSGTGWYGRMVQGLDAARAAQLDAGLARIRARFVESLSDRIDALYEHLDALQDIEGWTAATAALRAQAHKLHGICGSVGFPRIGERAAQLEHRIDSLTDLSGPQVRDELRELVNRLLDEMERSLDAK